MTYKQRYKYTEEKLNDESIVREKVSRKRVNHCMLMAYSGSKYYGMQYQSQDILTIEGILFKALLNSKWINQDIYNQPKAIKYQEASRTDKGVSATRQCCSILLRKLNSDN